MSLPANIFPIERNPVQKRSNDGNRFIARIRSRVQEKRAMAGLSLSDLSRKTGLSRACLSMFLNGYDPSPKTIQKLKTLAARTSLKRRIKGPRKLLITPAYWVPDAI